jgi:hypothetical protein
MDIDAGATQTGNWLLETPDVVTLQTSLEV